MLKKLLAVLLSLALIVSFSACGQKPVQEQENEGETIEQTDGETEGEDIQVLPGEDENSEDVQDPAQEGKDENEASQNQGESGGKTEPVKPEANTDSKLEYEGLEFGVRESGEDIICTIVDEASGMPCEITYDFENDSIVAIRAVYKCTEEYVDAIIETLKADTSVKASSIKRSGNNVSCEMTDAEVADMAGISHSLLYSVLKNAISD